MLMVGTRVIHFDISASLRCSFLIFGLRIGKKRNKKRQTALLLKNGADRGGGGEDHNSKWNRASS